MADGQSVKEIENKAVSNTGYGYIYLDAKMTHRVVAMSAGYVNNRLADLIERMATANISERTETIFQTPRFNEKGDIEYFMLRF